MQVDRVFYVFLFFSFSVLIRRKKNEQSLSVYCIIFSYPVRSFQDRDFLQRRGADQSEGQKVLCELSLRFFIFYGEKRCFFSRLLYIPRCSIGIRDGSLRRSLRNGTVGLALFDFASPWICMMYAGWFLVSAVFSSFIIYTYHFFVYTY